METNTQVSITALTLVGSVAAAASTGFVGGPLEGHTSALTITSIDSFGANAADVALPSFVERQTLDLWREANSRLLALHNASAAVAVSDSTSAPPAPHPQVATFDYEDQKYLMMVRPDGSAMLYRVIGGTGNVAGQSNAEIPTVKESQETTGSLLADREVPEDDSRRGHRGRRRSRRSKHQHRSDETSHPPLEETHARGSRRRSHGKRSRKGKGSSRAALRDLGENESKSKSRQTSKATGAPPMGGGMMPGGMPMMAPPPTASTDQSKSQAEAPATAKAKAATATEPETVPPPPGVAVAAETVTNTAKPQNEDAAVSVKPQTGAVRPVTVQPSVTKPVTAQGGTVPVSVPVPVPATVGRGTTQQGGSDSTGPVPTVAKPTDAKVDTTVAKPTDAEVDTTVAEAAVGAPVAKPDESTGDKTRRHTEPAKATDVSSEGGDASSKTADDDVAPEAMPEREEKSSDASTTADKSPISTTLPSVTTVLSATQEDSFQKEYMAGWHEKSRKRFWLALDAMDQKTAFLNSTVQIMKDSQASETDDLDTPVRTGVRLEDYAKADFHVFTPAHCFGKICKAFKLAKPYTFENLFSSFIKDRSTPLDTRKNVLSTRLEKGKCLLSYLIKAGSLIAAGDERMKEPSVCVTLVSLNSEYFDKKLAYGRTIYAKGKAGKAFKSAMSPITAHYHPDDVASGEYEVDFANRFIGGGVLRGGCLQEEIRFISSPEMLMAKSVFGEAPMGDHQAIVISGAGFYNRTEGYGTKPREYCKAFKYLGPTEDPYKHASAVVAIDATRFKDKGQGVPPRHQFSDKFLQREFRKATAGFLGMHFDAGLRGIVPTQLKTGDWGCGDFGGDPTTKRVIQMDAMETANQLTGVDCKIQFYLDNWNKKAPWNPQWSA